MLKFSSGIGLEFCSTVYAYHMGDMIPSWSTCTLTYRPACILTHAYTAHSHSHAHLSMHTYTHTYICTHTCTYILTHALTQSLISYFHVFSIMNAAINNDNKHYLYNVSTIKGVLKEESKWKLTFHSTGTSTYNHWFFPSLSHCQKHCFKVLLFSK